MNVNKLKYILIISIVGLIMISCEEKLPTWVDPNPSDASTPAISSIEPDTAFGGESVVIRGSNFNPNPEKNFVAFGKSAAEPDSASDTTLYVITPTVGGIDYTTVGVRATVDGCEYWSNEVNFTFPPILTYVDTTTNWPNGVAVDNDKNVYIASKGDQVIYKVTPDGSKSIFVDNIPVGGAMEFGFNNYLYACEVDEGKIVRISPDGSIVEDVVSVNSPIDFDWDIDDNMYIVANWDGIYKLDNQDNLTQVVSIDNPKCIRIYENHLYVSDIWNCQILRYEITAGGLENEEVIIEGDCDIEEAPLGVELDINGTLYYTWAWETTLYTLTQDGTEGLLFEGMLMTPMRFLTYHDKSIYIVYPGWGDVGKVMRAFLGVKQAPNYGIE